MARQTKPLSVKEIESAKPKEADYVLYDGDGLELLIKSSGSKIWQFRYIRPVTKKRARKISGALLKEMSFLRLATLALQILKLIHWFRPYNRFRPEEHWKLFVAYANVLMRS